MKLIDLKREVDRALKGGENDDLVVCIPNNKLSMGPIGATQVKAARPGFDWNKHMFIIWPEVDMVENSKKEI